ncbi:hemerythrin domain-containing protein [Actibacterium sp. D379-3]
MDNPLSLDRRPGLPDALRVLLADYPRDIWESHGNFDGLTRFWLGRHLMFRDLLSRLQQDAGAVLGGDLDPRRYQQRTARLAGTFLNELHGHHQIEDHHYFPQLCALDLRLGAGFDLLDADHHALDAHIHGLADLTNAMLRAGPDVLRPQAGALRDALDGFAGFLDRHLTDEEELVVPLILAHGQHLDR